MNQDARNEQALRMAEEALSLKEIVDLAKYYGMGGAYLEFAQAAIAAALAKLTEGQEPVAYVDDKLALTPTLKGVFALMPGMQLYTHPIPSQQEERIRELEKALDRIVSAVDWFLGISSFTQSKQGRGLAHSENVRKEMYAAYEAAKSARNKEQGK